MVKYIEPFLSAASVISYVTWSSKSRTPVVVVVIIGINCALFFYSLRMEVPRQSHSIISIELGLIAQVAGSVFANGNLYTLLRKALAECGAFNYTRELLSRVDSEGVRETASKHGTLLAMAENAVGIFAATDVGHHKLQSVIVSLDQWVQGDGVYLKVPSVRTERSWRTNQKPGLPSGSFSLKALTAIWPIRFRVWFWLVLGAVTTGIWA
jgi:hypothetical protein